MTAMATSTLSLSCDYPELCRSVKRRCVWKAENVRMQRSGRGFGRRSAFDLSPSAHIFGIGCHGVEDDVGHIGIVLDVRVQVARGVSDCGVSHPYPPIQPRAAPEPADHRNRDSGRDRSAHHWAGIGEVEQRGASIFQELRLFYQLRRQIRGHLRARLRSSTVGDTILQSGLWSNAKLRKNWDASTANGAYRVRKLGRTIQLDHIRARLFDHQDGRSQRGISTFLERTERKVAADKRPFNTAANSLANHQHLVHRDLQGSGMAP